MTRGRGRGGMRGGGRGGFGGYGRGGYGAPRGGGFRGGFRGGRGGRGYASLFYEDSQKLPIEIFLEQR